MKASANRSQQTAAADGAAGVVERATEGVGDLVDQTAAAPGRGAGVGQQADGCVAGRGQGVRLVPLRCRAQHRRQRARRLSRLGGDLQPGGDVVTDVYKRQKLYWLLYEGTPGGQLDLATDLVVRSDGTTTTAGESWSGDLPGEEWVFFADPTLGRSFYTVHHEPDEIVDSYTPDSLGMTILGYGRNGNGRYLEGTGRQMTLGLVEDTATDAVAAALHAAYKPLEVSVGQPEERPATPTPSPSPTSEPTNTPKPTRTPTPVSYTHL